MSTQSQTPESHHQSPSQPEYVSAMREGSFYPHSVQTIILRETHISRVFLTGPLVYKVKKPIEMGFLDFTTLKKRGYYCHREVELNQRLTSGVYEGVTAITREENGLQLDGPGPAEEYAVRMKQLDPEHSLTQMLPNKIDDTAVNRLARKLARFYERAAAGHEIDHFGTKEAIAGNCRENFQQLRQAGREEITRRYLQIIEAATRDFLEKNQDLLEKRISNGRIRDGHGDLRTDHVYFTEDEIQIIDCIEFNDRFRYSDVACDLAFLAMDLDFQGCHRLAGSLMTAFSEHSGDRRIFSLLDFYKCYRAMVRVKVSYLRLRQEGLATGEKTKLTEQMNRYLGLAYRSAVQFSRPMIWVVCGQAATGKSTLAKALADALNIEVIRSDVVRKELFPEADSRAAENRPFQEGIYSRNATALTYGQLLLRAQEKIEKGDSVILDATFSSRENRREVLRLAEETGALAIFVECACDLQTIKNRLLRRSEKESVSDARIQHLEDLKATYEEPTELSEQCLIRIDSGKPLDKNLSDIFMYTATPRDCLERGWLPA